MLGEVTAYIRYIKLRINVKIYWEVISVRDLKSTRLQSPGKLTTRNVTANINSYHPRNLTSNYILLHFVTVNIDKSKFYEETVV
jgi:hypothetical protein